MQENLTQTAEEAMDKMNEGVEKAKESTTQSLKDWYAYVEAHPLQSLLFGAVIYFACKGLMTSK